MLIEKSAIRHNLIDLIADPLAILDKNGNIIEINQQAEKITGYEKKELVGKNFLKTRILSSKSKIISMKNLGKRMLGLNVEPYEVEVLTKDGEKLHFEINAKIIQYEGETVDLVIFRDITTRKKRENELQLHSSSLLHLLKNKNEQLTEKEKRFQNITESSIDIIYEMDLDTKITYVSPSIKEITGYDQEEIVGRHLHELTGKIDASQLPHILKEISEGKKIKGLQIEAVRKDGKCLILEVNSAPLLVGGEIVGFQGIIRDITESIEMQESLKLSEETHRETSEFLNNILSSMADYVTIFDEDYNIRFLNKIAKRVYGEVVGKKCYEVIRGRNSPCYLSGIPCEIHEIIEKGKPSFEDTRLSQSTKRITHIRAKPTTSIEGKKALICVSRDVTDQKNTKEQLEKSYSILQTTLESTADGIFVVDSEKITHYNQKWLRMLNIPNSILSTCDDKEIIKYTSTKVKDPETFKQNNEKLVLNPDMEISDMFEWDDGRIFERHSHPHKINGKTVGRVVSIRDITEKKKMEDKLRNYSQYLERMVKDRTEELESNRQFLYTILDTIPDHVFIKDRQLKYAFTNRAHQKFHRKNDTELVGKTVYDFYPKQWADHLTRIDKEVLTKGITSEEPKESTINAEGKPAILHVIKAPLRNKKGDVTHLVGVARDVTKIKCVEEQFERIFNLSVDMICIADINGYFKKVNPSFQKILGCTEDELLSKPFLDFVHPDDKEKTLEIIEDKLRREETVFDFQNRFQCKDGSYKWLSWTSKPIPKEGKIIAIARDITENKKIEEMKEQFISTVTHELRTPIVSIKAYLDLALAGKLGELAEQLKSALEITNRNANRLLRLTEDLMDTKRIEAGRLQLNITTLDLKKITEHSIKEIKPLLNEKKQKLHIEYPDKKIPIKGDGERLIQVLINLLSNSNKFTSEGGNINLRVEETSKNVTVQVSDTGIGIRKEDLRHIFKPFAKIEKPTYIKGTGLGLSVSEGLIKAHGGQMWAESPGLENGSTFTFTLPTQIN